MVFKITFYFSSGVVRATNAIDFLCPITYNLRLLDSILNYIFS